jgi:hypothetical protein
LDVFYHLDSTGVSLEADKILELISISLEGKPKDEVRHKIRFPEGLSHFGDDIIHGRLEPLALDREKEVERVRRAKYSYRQSRYISVFGCKKIEDIERLRKTLFHPWDNGPRGRIWKVKGDATFHSDMNWFETYCYDNTAAADAYWSQEASEKPLVEYLLKPPVTVLHEVLGHPYSPDS